MEGESPTQVASPSFHQLPNTINKKRNPPWRNPNPPQQRPEGEWNPNCWSWDSFGFVAKPVEGSKGSSLEKDVEEGDDGGALSLKAGGGGGPSNKRVRSGSPAAVSRPMCQVDDCLADLMAGKDYHRRHKVCESHSKAIKVLVGNRMQRFCQQCSRFHFLSEFDEDKRSCRRRLAGHNRRRRKTQSDETTSWTLPQDNKRKDGENSSLEIANLLSVLSRLQDKRTAAPPLPDKDHVINILNKTNSLPTANTSLRPEAATCFDQNPESLASQHEQSTKLNDNPSAPSTMDLLVGLSAAPSPSTRDLPAALSQGSSSGSGGDKTRMPCMEAVADVTSANMIISNQKNPLHEPRLSLSFQFFSSAEEEDSPLKLGSTRKYLSSESSNPVDHLDDGSPSSSPPTTRKLFPLHSTRESTKEDRSRTSICRADFVTNDRRDAPLDLFKHLENRVGDRSLRDLQYQAGCTSSSESDQTPSCSNSDYQDRTGRVLFKLFGKDPSSLPSSLRSEILNWLSHKPREIESYIRPGCVVLSVYLSMPSIAWDELEKDLLQKVSSLVQCCESEFLQNGRFSVQTSRQLALYKDGKVRIRKSLRSRNALDLTFVSPVAVVSGKAASLLLKGRNLSTPGTKIHCTYMGGYMSKDFENYSSGGFTFPGGSPNIFGRCFIEVENGFEGGSFPIIIADAVICQELRSLESVFEEVRPDSKDDVLHFLNELGWLFQRKNIADPFVTDFSCARFKYLLMFSVERDWCAIIRTLLDMLVERSLEGGERTQESLEMLQEIGLLSRAVKRKCRKMADFLLHYSVKSDINGSKVYLFPPNSLGPGGVTPLHLAASMMDSEEMVDALTNDPQEIGLKCWSSIKDDSGQYPYMYASMRSNHSYNKLVIMKLTDRGNSQISVTVGDQVIGPLESTAASEPERPIRSCTQCAIMEAARLRPRILRQGILHLPYVNSILAIAAVCVCVGLFCRGGPKLGLVDPFKWENLEYGPR